MTDWYGYPYIALTGGADGALDSLDGSLLKDGDFSLVVVPGTQSSYIYTLDSDSGAAESSPDVIAPDYNAGNKRWILVESGNNINFTQTGTGAVSRTVDSKLKDFVTPEDFGAVGNGTTTDTVAVQAALAEAAALYLPEGRTYKVGALTIPSTVRKIFGSGTLLQAAQNANILVGTAAADLVIDGISFQGAWTTNQSTLVGSNTAISLTGASNVVIQNCSFKLIEYVVIQLTHCTDCRVTNNRLYQCGPGIYLRGCNGVELIGNHINGTIFDNTVFTIPISLESTEGHVYGICSDIAIIGNSISGYYYAQGIEAHAGQHIKIIGNTVRDAVEGIVLNTYNATDELGYVSIIGNTVECPATVTGFSPNGNDGIIVAGSAATLDVYEVQIIGNTVVNGNRAQAHASQGGIRVEFTKRVVVQGNTIIASKRNGIVLTDDEEDVLVNSNLIQGTIVSTTQNGINVMGAASGQISNNVFRGHTDAAGLAIVFAKSNTLSVHGNEYLDSTKAISGMNYVGSMRGTYVNRGDPSAADFAVGVLTTDGSWHDLDLSLIVPIGASAVMLHVTLTDDTPSKAIQFRKNGNAQSQAGPTLGTQVANVITYAPMAVSCDEGRVIEYSTSNTTFTTINIVVAGWWI